jgi:1-acyl-sn-glycerol-3-phosphate acyltransferase
LSASPPLPASLSGSVLRSLTLWSASAGVTTLWLPLVAGIWVFDRDPLKRRTGRAFRRLGVALARIHRARVPLQRTDLPDPRGVYVVVSNHQSLADIPILCHLPWEMKWIAKAELFRVPIVGWMMRLAADIPVDRARRARPTSAFRQASRALQAGFMVFPEGTRSRNGRVAPFTDGAFKLAVQAGVPILPVAIDGSGAWMPRGVWRVGRPTRLRVRVFPPIDTRQLCPSDTAALREQAREAIVRQVSAWRDGAPSAGGAS